MLRDRGKRDAFDVELAVDDGKKTHGFRGAEGSGSVAGGTASVADGVGVGCIEVEVIDRIT